MYNKETMCRILDYGRTDFRKHLFPRAKQVLENKALHHYLEELEASGARLREKSLPVLTLDLFTLFEKTGNRLQYEEIYFKRREQLVTYGILFWLYRREEDKIKLEGILSSVCEEYTWALPAHLRGKTVEAEGEENTLDLFACETAQLLAELITMAGNDFSSELAQRCKSEVRRRVLAPFMEAKEKYPWEEMCNNWCAVCGGSIGMAAIYLEEDTEKLADALLKLYPTVQRFLDSFEEDGACLEGLSYWTYGMGYFTAFADLLRRRTGGKTDLFCDSKVGRIASFQAKCYFEGGRTISISDGHSRDYFRLGLTSFLAKEYGVGTVGVPPGENAATLHSDSCYRWVNITRDLWWSDAEVLSYKSSRGNDILPYAQWMIFRSSTAGVVIKGGHNDEPHNHNDIGSLLIFLKGGELISDLGCGEYTKDYFSENRYDIFCNSSFSHSVPVINGKGQKAGRAYQTAGWHADHKEVSMDIAPAYGLEALSFLRRKITFLKNGVALYDRFSFDSTGNCVEERFISRQKPKTISENCIRLMTEDGAGGLIRFRTGEFTTDFHEETHKEHDGSDKIVYVISLKKHLMKRDYEAEIIIEW